MNEPTQPQQPREINASNNWPDPAYRPNLKKSIATYRTLFRMFREFAPDASPDSFIFTQPLIEALYDGIGFAEELLTAFNDKEGEAAQSAQSPRDSLAPNVYETLARQYIVVGVLGSIVECLTGVNAFPLVGIAGCCYDYAKMRLFATPKSEAEANEPIICTLSGTSDGKGGAATPPLPFLSIVSPSDPTCTIILDPWGWAWRQAIANALEKNKHPKPKDLEAIIPDILILMLRESSQSRPHLYQPNAVQSVAWVRGMFQSERMRFIRTTVLTERTHKMDYMGNKEDVPSLGFETSANPVKEGDEL